MSGAQILTRVRRLAMATGDERGMVLPLTLMFMLILTTLSVALLTVGGQETLIAANHLRGIQAQFLAEAGLEDAFKTFRNNTTLLTSSSVPSSLTTLTGLSGPGSTLSAYGGYTVQYQSAGTDTVRVVVTGYTSTSGSPTATHVIGATLSVAFSNNNAVRTAEDLSISGNPTINGTCGSVHTNDDLTISGNPSIAGAATAYDQYSVSGNPTVGSGSGGSKPKKSIPTVSASDFLTKAKATVPASQVFQFKDGGQVRDGSDTLLTTLSDGQTYRGWEYDSGSTDKWTFSGNTAYDGTYYFEGNVKVSGNPGSSSTPWNVTIIATKDIEMSGNPDVNVHSIDTFLASGDDIKISGNLTMHEAGVIAMREHFQITGNPTIIGYIYGQNGEDIGGGNLTISSNTISGNPTITYACGLNPPIPGDLTILAWGF
jgi:Tfp pilus assembly protein PilX